MPTTQPHRDPYAKAPWDELHEPILPRWFVLLALASIPVALVVLVLALTSGGGGGDLSVAARRPPPVAGLSTAVGDLAVGDADPVAYEGACPLLRGVRVAGTAADRAALQRGLAGLCNAELPSDVADRLRAFAAQGGVVRFATFAATGVDSTSRLPNEPIIYVNSKYARTNPLWIAPLVAHDTTFLAADPALAATALAARRAEHAVCRALLGAPDRSRACRDAAGLLALDDPLEALRAAGYR